MKFPENANIRARSVHLDIISNECASSHRLNYNSSLRAFQIFLFASQGSYEKRERSEKLLNNQICVHVHSRSKYLRGYFSGVCFSSEQPLSFRSPFNGAREKIDQSASKSEDLPKRCESRNWAIRCNKEVSKY